MGLLNLCCQAMDYTTSYTCMVLLSFDLDGFHAICSMCMHMSQHCVKLRSLTCIDTKLTTADLSTVYEKLYSARTKWFNIGLLLNNDNTTLESIRVRNRDDPDGCLREMLTRRLQAGGPLTWRNLCDSLRSPIVGRDDVAKEIEQWVESKPSEPSKPSG